MSERHPNTYDNTTLVLSFSEQDRDGRTYFRCLPDMDLEVTIMLSECHMVFDPATKQLRISRNRNL